MARIINLDANQAVKLWAAVRWKVRGACELDLEHYLLSATDFVHQPASDANLPQSAASAFATSIEWTFSHRALLSQGLDLLYPVQWFLTLGLKNVKSEIKLNLKSTTFTKSH